jgi:hypothetical protein
VIRSLTEITLDGGISMIYAAVAAAVADCALVGLVGLLASAASRVGGGS